MPPNSDQQIRSRDLHTATTQASKYTPTTSRTKDNDSNLDQQIKEGLSQTQIRIQDKIYDAEKLADFHPGGPLFISAFAGRDASQVSNLRD